MKTRLIALLLLLGFSAFAKDYDHSIDDEMNYKVQWDVKDPSRSLASEKELQNDEEKKQEESKDRSVASEVEVEDKIESSGIRFWKY